MNHHLVVVHDFKTYKRGDMITDEAEVANILASPQHPHVVKIQAPTPAPAPDVAPAEVAHAEVAPLHVGQ